MRGLLAWVVWLGGVVACKPPEAATAPAVRSSWPAVSSADVYFPLEDGRLYHYVSDDNGEPGMLVAHVSRAEARRGQLRIGNQTKNLVYDESGVRYQDGAYLLKVPLEVGASWPGEHGGTTRITDTSRSVQVPAGRYEQCIETVEEVGERYLNTYCPGVGLVRLEVSGARGQALVTLKHYGAPVTP